MERFFPFIVVLLRRLSPRAGRLKHQTGIAIAKLNRPAVKNIFSIFIWHLLVQYESTRTQLSEKLSPFCQGQKPTSSRSSAKTCPTNYSRLCPLLVELAGVQPDTVASRALVDLNLLEASRFQGRAALRTVHVASFLQRRYRLRFLLCL